MNYQVVEGDTWITTKKTRLREVGVKVKIDYILNKVVGFTTFDGNFHETFRVTFIKNTKFHSTNY